MAKKSRTDFQVARVCLTTRCQLSDEGSTRDPLLFVEGAQSYYGTRGFDRADTVGFRSPSLRIPPPAFQVVRLSCYEEWMTGTLVYSETFWALDCVGLRDPAIPRFG